LFRRVNKLQDEYEAYHKAVFAITQKYKKKKTDPALERLSERQRDLEIYDKTTPMVSRLYERIYRN
jgi:hypothetical protein